MSESSHLSFYFYLISTPLILLRGPSTLRKIQGGGYVLHSRSPLKCWCLNWFYQRWDKTLNLPDQICLQHIFLLLYLLLFLPSYLFWSLPLGHMLFIFGDSFYAFYIECLLKSFLCLCPFWFWNTFSSVSSYSLHLSPIVCIVPVLLLM